MFASSDVDLPCQTLDAEEEAIKVETLTEGAYYLRLHRYEWRSHVVQAFEHTGKCLKHGGCDNLGRHHVRVCLTTGKN